MNKQIQEKMLNIFLEDVDEEGLSKEAISLYQKAFQIVLAEDKKLLQELAKR